MWLVCRISGVWDHPATERANAISTHSWGNKALDIQVKSKQSSRTRRPDLGVLQSILGDSWWISGFLNNSLLLFCFPACLCKLDDSHACTQVSRGHKDLWLPPNCLFEHCLQGYLPAPGCETQAYSSTCHTPLSDNLCQRPLACGKYGVSRRTSAWLSQKYRAEENHHQSGHS